ncbi:MAG: hypothetical protein GXX85_03960 [Ignavibacteria bacterium]|nr:hypothetical protein [Ignavibacteria bacterium]
MRVLKTNNADYEPFHKLLQTYSPNDEYNNEIRFAAVATENNSPKLTEKYAHLFQNMISFSSEIANLKDPQEISEKFKLTLKRILPIKDASLLFFDGSLSKLSEVGNNKYNIEETMNHYFREGILNVLFDTQKPMIIPELKSMNNGGSKLNFIIFPIFEDNKKKGILSILSSIFHKSFASIDKQIIQILLNQTLSKLDKIHLKIKLNTTIEEVQTYQAKLSNDFRLAAIGELTEGIVEDIMTPLQVIVSQIDMIVNENNESDVKKIKSQIAKINTSISRLVKFSNLNQKNVKIQPCNLNDSINEYYNLVKSTLENNNFELVMDFEQDIPSLLSHQNYIFQILTNVIGLIKANSKGEGGIIVQTKYKNDQIILKLISTANLKPYTEKNKSSFKSSDLNLRIVENLMNKHEGNYLIEAYDTAGSSITMNFPLKRKIRQ